jgi:hypothetical protein
VLVSSMLGTHPIRMHKRPKRLLCNFQNSNSNFICSGSRIDDGFKFDWLLNRQVCC